RRRGEGQSRAAAILGVAHTDHIALDERDLDALPAPAAVATLEPAGFGSIDAHLANSLAFSRSRCLLSCSFKATRRRSACAFRYCSTTSGSSKYISPV